ncbi:MAG: hypothetical protein ACRDGR_03590 [bacterium]
MRTRRPIVALAAFAPSVLLAADVPEELAARALRELPAEMSAAAGPGATSGSGASGRWSISAEQMDGAGAPEAILVVLPAGQPGRICFLAERAGEEPERRDVKLKGGPITSASVVFHPFAEGKAIAFIDGGTSGQALVGWNGEKLEEIWKIGKVRDDERHWFHVEDVDGDGVSEVVRFFRRELDVYTTEDELAGEGGAADRMMAGQVDAAAVYRWDGAKWREDRALLDGLK